MNTQEMNSIYKWGRFVLVILFVFLVIKSVSSLQSLGNTQPSYNTITVTGEGEAFAIPDIANFSFSISADAKTVSDAQSQVTEKMDKVLDAIKKLGVDDKDIKTTDYNAYPRYSYSGGVCTQYSCPPSKQTLDGYTATHSVTVKIRKTEDSGKILAAAGDNGATNLSGLNFTMDDPQVVTSEARAKAIEDARSRAKVLSDQLGVKLKRVVSFSDSTDGGVMPYYREAVGLQTKDASAPTPTLPTGENKVRVVVNVVYEIR
ncbi:SIMPL domain-containing protein [Candidatus Parcubacteria bacterium]|nr:SIMPL domain-containing protein [Candidatus Parcubacteria bacterium]